MEDWRKYRQDRSRRKANAYARASYINFKKTKFYRTTRIFDGTTIILGLLFSIVMIVFTIIGYIYKIAHPTAGQSPTLSMIFLMLVGMTFLVTSIAFLKAYIETSAKHSKKR